MTRRQVLRAASAFAAAGLAGARQNHAQTSRPSTRAPSGPPNFVFILSDNHRWDAMSSMGHPFVRTPHLDRIGREGLHFANAFCTTPLCSPARASFLTGMYAYRHGIQNHTTRAAWDDAHVTFLELLQRDAGYATAFIGKWHMPGSGVPHLRGVDRFVTFTAEGGQGRYFDCPLVIDGVPVASRRRYLTEELTDHALEFVSQARGQPFCLYLSHKAAHHPWRPAPDLEGIYANEPVDLPAQANSWTGFTNGQIWGGFDRPIESAYRSYMETVTSMDREIGRLLDALDELGLADDTTRLAGRGLQGVPLPRAHIPGCAYAAVPGRGSSPPGGRRTPGSAPARRRSGVCLAPAGAWRRRTSVAHSSGHPRPTDCRPPGSTLAWRAEVITGAVRR